MAKRINVLTAKKFTTGDVGWAASTERANAAMFRGAVSDGMQFGVRPGKSVRASHATTKVRNRANVGSFGRMKQSRRASINTGGNYGKLGY